MKVPEYPMKLQFGSTQASGPLTRTISRIDGSTRHQKTKVVKESFRQRLLLQHIKKNHYRPSRCTPTVMSIPSQPHGRKELERSRMAVDDDARQERVGKGTLEEFRDGDGTFAVTHYHHHHHSPPSVDWNHV